MNPDPQSIRLSSNWSSGLFTGIAGLLSLAYGFYLGVSGHYLGWVIFVVSIVAVFLFIHQKLLKVSVLTLSQGGFSLSDGSSTSAYRWSDIDSIQLSRSLLTTRVIFSLKNSEAPTSGVFGSDLLNMDSRGSRHLPDNFGLSAKHLKELMIQWQTQFRSRSD